MKLLRIVRGLVALGVLAALLAGVPVVLWILSHRFLPTRLPGVDDITAALLRPDDGSLLLALLVVVGWVVWALLATSVVIEIADRARSRRRAHPGVLRPTRAVAALLVGWVVTAFAATPANAAPLVTNAYLVPPAPARSESPGESGRVHVVAARDTLWDIAATELGDPLRWREILDLNRDRIQPNGDRLTDDAELQIGWTLALPRDTTAPPNRIQVQPADTLSSLAGRYLGDPARYGDIYRANSGAVQPDGHALTDPDLIRPGWLLRIPTQPGPTPAPNDPSPSVAPPPTAPTTPPTTTPSPTADGAVPSPATPTPASTGTPPDATPAAVPTPVPSRKSPTPTAPASGGARPATGSAVAVPAEWSAPTTPMLGVAGVVATGLLGGLLVLRRRQQRWRGHGRRIALPGAALSRLEAAVTAAAQPAGPQFLDLALRSLTTLTLGQYPALRAARLAPVGLDLILTDSQEPPAPFTAVDDDHVWHVPADAELPLTQATAIGVANPYPALAALGTTIDSTTVLLDIEQAGAVHLSGDPTRIHDLLRHLAVELGTSSTADGTTVLTVGLEPTLAGLPAHRVQTVVDLPTAVARLRAAMVATIDGLHQLDNPSLVDLRVRDQLSDAWLVTVLIVGSEHAAHELEDLRALCSDIRRYGRCAAAVVTAALPGPLDGTTIPIDPDGTATLPDLGEVWIEQMTAALADGVLDIIGTATAPDEAVTPTPLAEPWTEGMNEDGTPHDPSPDSESPAEPHTARPDPWRPPAAPTRPVSQESRRLLLAERQDPALDDDLALWHATATPPRPLITLLGPPGLRSPGTPPEKRHSWYLEVVIYLALHPHGVDRDKLMTDLWPDGSAIQPPTIRRAIAEARAWVGKDPTTDPADFIPAISPPGGDRYRITGHLTDWDLFRRLRKRAHARASASHTSAAMTDYTAALRLVRGPVLHPVRARGYAWLHNPDQRQPDLVPGFIIDTAHDLVDLALDTGDFDLARFAATTAQTVDPDRTSDRPFTDLMRIAHAAGDLDEMRTHAELLLAEREFEVGEELPPESFAVFNELFPHGLRVRAS